MLRRVYFVLGLTLLAGCAATISGESLYVDGVKAGAVEYGTFQYEIEEVRERHLALNVTNVADTTARFDPTNFLLTTPDGRQYTAWDRQRVCEMERAYSAAVSGAITGISVESCQLSDSQVAGPVLPESTVMKRLYFDELSVPFNLRAGVDTVMMVKK